MPPWRQWGVGGNTPLGPVGSVVLGGVGTVLVAVTWLRLFPALARRDRIA